MIDYELDLEGVSIGHFRLGRFIGHGGMGAVYEAEDTRSGRTVAVKLLLRSDEAEEAWLIEARRLRDEARAACRVDSPNIVSAIATGDDEELGPFIVYEYLPRGSLDRHVDTHGPLGLDEAVRRVATPLLCALSSLHGAGIVHRDIKPENLFQAEDGRFKVGDLGLALFEGRLARTLRGAMVGTPGYLAPERVKHPEQPATPAADCYAAAATIIYAVTGALPFQGDDPISLLHDQMTRDIYALDLMTLGVPGFAAAVLAEALARDLCLRRSDAAQMLRDLSDPPRTTAIGRTTLVEADRFEGLPRRKRAATTLTAALGRWPSVPVWIIGAGMAAAIGALGVYYLAGTGL